MNRPAPHWEIYLRSGLFQIVFAAFTVVWSVLVMLFSPAMPYRTRFNFAIGIYARVINRLLFLICQIEVDVIGRENIPENPCIIYSKHQSTWETFFLQTLFVPQCQVIKRELLMIPFFGWAFSLLAPIAIDRSKRREAMTQVLEQGEQRLNDGIWILIFPEGSRIPPGQRKPFTRGGATLAQATGRPLLPIAHNAGLHWPNNQFLKYPGKIRLVIGQPVPPQGVAVEQLTAQAEQWINQTSEELLSVDALEPQHFFASK